MNFLLSIVYFAVVLSILVFIHELGHLIAAKRFGVFCKEFAIGMGPTLFKIKKPHWETTYSIRALPLGGFVSMAGEPGEEDMDVPIERTMLGIARWKRLIIMLAGIFMNLVLAVVIYTAIFTANGIVDAPQPIVAAVVENSPASEAGLQEGDMMVQMEFADGSVVIPTTFSELQMGVAVYKDQPIKITIDRSGVEHELVLTPKFNETDKVYQIGVQSPPATQRDVGFFQSIPLAFAEIGNVIAQMWFLLSRVVRGIGADSLGGPIAIFGMTAEIQTYGFIYFLNLVALLSVNLAVVNLLPIPVMDGGRVVLTVIEMIIGRPIPEKIENFVMMTGLVLILAFFAFIMFNDISRLF
ncbi:RIP metalloprotease RseP [Erysipelothrix sp. HDW6C]|uniref:RIP metalloprotease RseP n=1 Tax=Erysipelothrix sp. HDW6C TaxID=2714930 RepID=UPI0014081FFC|nr:RIP metalloprotease RseP [Erysipelothrix sp. HDW6C]QIK69977.1 RIP metalloprotease RseP [Erysipelothrix sp. HDW6C]